MQSTFNKALDAWISSTCQEEEVNVLKGQIQHVEIRYSTRCLTHELKGG